MTDFVLKKREGKKKTGKTANVNFALNQHLLFYFQVSALSFSENGSFFVTVGVRHVKFWYFDTESNKSKVREI